MSHVACVYCGSTQYTCFDTDEKCVAEALEYGESMFQKPTVEQLQNRFMHHAPKGDQAERYGKVRQAILGAALECVALTPCSAEQTRAINALDEAMMLFNAAIARNEKEPT